MTREEQLACLKDRPCDVCKMRTDKGCSSWECVFEQTPDEEKSICNRCQHQIVCKLKDESTVVKCAEYLEIKRSDFEKCVPKPTTKENLVVEDAISRQKAIDAIDALYLGGDSCVCFRVSEEGDTLIGKYQAITALDDLPSVTLQPCEDAISRQAALALQIPVNLPGWSGYMIGSLDLEHLPSVNPKELKLDEVLDKIRAEIKTMFPHTTQDEYWDGYDSCRNDVLHILDKYKAEKER